MNLNTHYAYYNLRFIREKLRIKNKPITGQSLAQGLQKYSEKGPVYIKEIISMIKLNNLEKYNTRFT